MPVSILATPMTKGMAMALLQWHSKPECGTYCICTPNVKADSMLWFTLYHTSVHTATAEWLMGGMLGLCNKERELDRDETLTMKTNKRLGFRSL